MSPRSDIAFTFRSVLALAAACVPLDASEDGPWKIAADGRTLSVSTETLSATIRDGAFVQIEHRSAGPRLFVASPASGAFPALRDARGVTAAGPEARVECREIPGGAQISLGGLSGDASAETELDLSIGEDGDLIVRQSARREAPELLGASWGIAGIDASRARVIVPAVGGAAVDGIRGPGSLSFSWPSAWQAALVIVEGEGGGFSVWAEDPESAFKSLELRRFSGELTLAFGTESRETFEEARTVASPSWRIRPFRGDWKDAALAYRAAMASRIGVPPIAARKPEWIREIRLVVRVSNDVTVGHLGDLSKAVDPRQTLLYVPDWRKLPYDVLYPDYRPRDGFVAWCREAQGLGFRVMVHGNLVGIGPKSPELSAVETYLQTDRLTGERVGWYLDRPDHPGQIYCLNPASSEARRFLVERFRGAWETVGFDALHLDYPVIVSTRGGDIEGLTCARGAEVYLRELQAALPDVALGTEGLNELLLGCFVAQLGEPFWVRESSGMDVHLVRSLLFAPFTGLYGHLGMPSQSTSFPEFLEHHDFFDRLGSWPTLSLDGALDASDPGTDFVLREARYFQDLRLAPAPEETRLPAETFAWRAASGKVSAVFDDPPGRRLAPRDAPLDAVWRLLGRVNVYDGPGHVVDWRAFDGERLFGLDPSRRYPIVSAPADPRSLHLVSASGPIVLAEVRDSSRRSLFRLAGEAAVVADLLGEAWTAGSGILVSGKTEPIGWGATFSAVGGSCGGEPLPAILAHPPWQGGAVGGETYGEFSVDVPAEGRTVLRFATGLADLTDPVEIARDRETPLSDGVTFSIASDGEEIFRTHRLRGSWLWHEVDLSGLRGRRTTLRLVTGPGPEGHVAWDWALWGQPRVVRVSGGEAISVRLFSPHGEGLAFFGDGELPGRIASFTAAPGGVLVHVELPRLQPFGLLHDVTPVGPEADLPSLPFIVGSLSAELLREGSVYGSGSVGTASVDGESWRTLSGHPPAFGRTCLDWCLRLPRSPLRLEFHCRVLEGGGPVSFEVQVNGAGVWALPMPQPAGWKKGSVDLRPWAGRPILLSLVTDSLGTNNCDWAVWGDLRLAADGSPVEGGMQRPADCNQNGAQDMSDAVCLLGRLFLGRPGGILCEGGVLSDRGSAALLDYNGDASLDLSDGVALLARLFLGGPPHALGEGCLWLEGCPENASCLR